MSLTYIRVVNQQTINRSLLIDKIDISQSNFTDYAQRAKQKIYIPYVNPLDTSVKGYLNLVPTDEVLLSAANGTISGLTTKGYITKTLVAASLLQTAVVTSAVNSSGSTTIDGTTFLSVAPDITYVTITNLSAVSQKIPSSAFTSVTATEIIIPDGAVTIGSPTTGWKVVVQANSKSSNSFTL